MDHGSIQAAVSIALNNREPGRGRDADTCKVFSGIFSIIVQGLLFLVCSCSLLLKWRFERYRRTLKIFLLDTSKQIVGAGYLHMLNMVFASLQNHGEDQCAQYWMNLMLDCTLGLVVVWITLRCSEFLCDFSSGYYSVADGIDWENNPNYTRWACQIVGYLCIITVKKTLIYILLWVSNPAALDMAIAATHWIRKGNIRLLYVMIFSPLVMDTFSFWVQDWFLKFQFHHSEMSDGGSTEREVSLPFSGSWPLVPFEGSETASIRSASWPMPLSNIPSLEAAREVTRSPWQCSSTACVGTIQGPVTADMNAPPESTALDVQKSRHEADMRGPCECTASDIQKPVRNGNTNGHSEDEECRPCPVAEISRTSMSESC